MFWKKKKGLNEVKFTAPPPPLPLHKSGGVDNESTVIMPFTEEMYSFLLVNAMRSLTEEQKAGLCFDLYDRSGLKERIDEKIKMVKS